MKIAIAIAVAALAVSDRATADKLDDDPAVRAMKDELARAMDKLELPGVGKPYFLSYELWDERTAEVDASFGAVDRRDEGPRRIIDIELRVGDYALDNSNFAGSFGQRHSFAVPADNDYDAIRRDLWLATDRAYKSAGEALERKQAVIKEETKSADTAPSFSKDPPAKVVAPGAITEPSLAPLEQIATKLSAIFRHNPDAYRATVSVVEFRGNRTFVSSEGALASEPETSVRVTVECSTQADDGTPLRDALAFVAPTVDQLPAAADMIAQVTQLSKELSAVRAAPIVEDYGGPVVFRGAAAGQLVRALLAEDFSGTPAPKGDHPGARSIGESELVGKVGQRILPAGTSVVDDPTLDQIGGQALSGHYKLDEEGIAPQRVSLVENGLFRRFLMSRAPRKGFEHSTGHGRSTPMAPVRAHPANLIVSSTKGIPDKELVRRALAAAKDQGLGYILVVDKLGTGDPSDFDPSMFADGGPMVPKPIVMKRVYPDGREELVRGGVFGALPIHAFKDLLAMGSAGVAYHYLGSGLPRRFEGMVDAPRGFPVTIVAPSLAFRDVDVKKPLGPQAKPPIAPRP